MWEAGESHDPAGLRPPAAAGRDPLEGGCGELGWKHAIVVFCGAVLVLVIKLNAVFYSCFILFPDPLPLLSTKSCMLKVV